MELRGFRLRFCTRPEFWDRPLEGLVSTSISKQGQAGYSFALICSENRKETGMGLPSPARAVFSSLWFWSAMEAGKVRKEILKMVGGEQEKDRCI